LGLFGGIQQNEANTRQNDALLAELDQKYKTKESYRPVFAQMTMNIMFYMKKQWIEDKDGKGSFVPMRFSSNDVHVTVNKIRPMCRTEWAKLNKNQPKFEVIPGNTDDTSQKVARACHKLIDYLAYVHKMTKKQREVTLWQLIAGNGFMKVYWDTNRGPELPIPMQDEMGNIVRDETGEIVPEQDPKTGQPMTMKEGDIHICVVSPFSLTWPLNILDVEEAPWVIEDKVWSVSQVKEYYGIDVEPEPLNKSEYVANSLIDMINGSNDFTSAQRAQSVVVKEYWEKPTKANPNGRYIVWAGETILYQGDFPYAHKKLPYVKFDHIPAPGRFHGTGSPEDVIPIQELINDAWTQIVKNRRILVYPKLLTPEGAIADDAYSPEEGEIIEYNPLLGKPEFLNPPQLPQWVFQTLNIHYEDVDDMGMHDVSNGEMPKNIESGSGLEYLGEQDETKIGPTVASLEDGMTEVFTQALELFAQFVEIPRMIRVVGKNKLDEAIELKGQDILGFEYEVRVIKGSAMPENKPARINYILDLVDRGVFVDPITGKTDTRKVLQLLEFGQVDQVFDDVNLDLNEAENENRMMETSGQFMEPQYWQNHEVHLYQHNRRRKTEEWKQLHPQLQQMYEAHIQMHIQQMMMGTVTTPMTPDGMPRPVDSNVTGALQVNPMMMQGQGGLPPQAFQAMQRIQPQPAQADDQMGRQTVTVNKG
jgi:hypothetical protein